MNAHCVVPFVAQHNDWIRDTRSRLLARMEQQTACFQQLLPEKIEFKACVGCWQVSYLLEPGLRSSLTESASLLTVRAADEASARQTLQRWLNRKARSHLLPRLHQLSRETGLNFRRLSIRAQKTRWGSCSSTGTISLNRALMFVDTALVRYLLIHELCHTQQMNHSPRYWALVQRHEPAYKDYERHLRAVAGNIPVWARLV